MEVKQCEYQVPRMNKGQRLKKFSLLYPLKLRNISKEAVHTRFEVVIF